MDGECIVKRELKSHGGFSQTTKQSKCLYVLGAEDDHWYTVPHCNHFPNMESRC